MFSCCRDSVLMWSAGAPVGHGLCCFIDCCAFQCHGFCSKSLNWQHVETIELKFRYSDCIDNLTDSCTS